MIKKAHVVYFSGTGCTALAAKTLSAALLDAGVQTRISEMVWNHAFEPEADETLVLLFPVYAADAPGTVTRWLATLPKRIHGTAVVVSVSGGGEVSPNTACRVRSIRRLTHKGYAVTGEYMLCMPSNFIMPTPDDLAIKLLRVLPEKCARIAAEIAAGTKRRKQPRFSDRLLLILFSAEKVGAKFFGKMLKAGTSCNGCGLCARQCPSGNIRIQNGKPKFGWKCVLCMRCLYAGPQHTIRAGMPVLKHMTLRDGFDLQSIQAMAASAAVPDTAPANASMAWKGASAYFDSDTV